jgi:hypothetical protein
MSWVRKAVPVWALMLCLLAIGGLGGGLTYVYAQIPQETITAMGQVYTLQYDTSKVGICSVTPSYDGDGNIDGVLVEIENKLNETATGICNVLVRSDGNEGFGATGFNLTAVYGYIDEPFVILHSLVPVSGDLARISVTLTFE